MMARTQILKDIRPNIFLDKRKVFGILFFFVIHHLSANVTFFNIPSLTEEEKEILISDSIISDSKEDDSIISDNNIYITSGTTIIDLDDTIEGEIIAVKKSVPEFINKTIVKKTTPEKVVKLVDTKNHIKKYSKGVSSCFYPSSNKNLYHSISESCVRAIVSSQVLDFKVFIKAFNVISYQVNVELSRNKNYRFCNHILKSKFYNSLSGRAPPILG